MKRAAVLFLGAVLAVGLSVPVMAAEPGFPDIQGHWAQDVILRWQDYGVIQGYGTGFHPNDHLTRAELSAMVNRILCYPADPEQTYLDLPPDAWYSDDMTALSAAGILQGDGDGTIRPNDPVTREEVAVMLCRVFGIEAEWTYTDFLDRSEIAPWAQGYVAALYHIGAVEGYQGRFDPKLGITRAQALTLLDKLVPGVMARAGVWTRNVVGDLMVSAEDVEVQGCTISGDLIVTGGAASGDVVLSNVTVKGQVILQGGGRSLHIRNGSQIDRIVAAKTIDGVLHVNNETPRAIPALLVSDGLDDVILEGPITAITVESDVPVQLRRATVDTLTISAPDASVTVEKGCAVAALEIAEQAEGAYVSVAGAVKAMNTYAAAQVKNEGTITALTVGADGLVLDGTKPSSLTVVKGVDRPVDPSGKQVYPGTSGGSSGGGGGGSSTPSTPVTLDTLTVVLEAPAFGQTPGKATVQGSGCTAQTQWQNADGTPALYRLDNKTFTASQAYQAVVTLTPSRNYNFAEAMTVQVADAAGQSYTPDSVEVSGTGRVVTLTYPATPAKDPVEALKATGPKALQPGETGTAALEFTDNLLADPTGFTFQWYKGEEAIEGATGKTYAIPAEDTADEGTLTYLCKLSLPAAEGEDPQVFSSSPLTVEVRTIQDPAAVPTPAFADTITLSTASGNNVTGSFQVTDGTVLNNQDVTYTTAVQLSGAAGNTRISWDAVIDSQNPYSFSSFAAFELVKEFSKLGASAFTIDQVTVTMTPSVYDSNTQDFVSQPDKTGTKTYTLEEGQAILYRLIPQGTTLEAEDPAAAFQPIGEILVRFYDDRPECAVSTPGLPAVEEPDPEPEQGGEEDESVTPAAVVTPARPFPAYRGAAMAVLRASDPSLVEAQAWADADHGASMWVFGLGADRYSSTLDVIRLYFFYYDDQAKTYYVYEAAPDHITPVQE